MPPAARVGDPLAHGGVIVAGCPTVIIGGSPAARLGDMHVCPACNPGKACPPHVGGPIAKGNPTVLIGGMPAACMGDMAVCQGPPDSIVMGAPTVLIGSGGGGGGGGGAAAAASTAANQAMVANKRDAIVGPHWIEYEIQDNAGNPIVGKNYLYTDVQGNTETNVLTGNGIVTRGGLPEEGQCTLVIQNLTDAAWSVEEANVGDTVEITATTHGFEEGTPAKIEIFLHDIDGADDLMATIETEISGEKIEGEWRYQLKEPVEEGDEKQDEQDKRRAYSAPVYYFKVTVEKCRVKSPMLYYQDYLEITVDSEGNDLTGQEYELTFANGEVRTGLLDSSGIIREGKVPPGTAKLFVGGTEIDAFGDDETTMRAEPRREIQAAQIAQTESLATAEIAQLTWSNDRFKPGTPVTLAFNATNIKGQDTASIIIYECDTNGSKEKIDSKAMALNKGDGQYTLDWQRSIIDAEKDLDSDKYANETGPLEYRYEVVIGATISPLSSALLMQTTYEVIMSDAEANTDNTLANVSYQISKNNKVIQTGTTDNEGKIKLRCVDASAEYAIEILDNIVTIVPENG